jgi:hypothetical protein
VENSVSGYEHGFKRKKERHKTEDLLLSAFLFRVVQDCRRFSVYNELSHKLKVDITSKQYSKGYVNLIF